MRAFSAGSSTPASRLSGCDSRHVRRYAAGWWVHSADEVGCLHLTGWQKPLRPQLDMRIKNIRCYGRRAVSMSTLAAGEHAGVQRLTQLYLRVGGHPALVLQAKQLTPGGGCRSASVMPPDDEGRDSPGASLSPPPPSLLVLDDESSVWARSACSKWMCGGAQHAMFDRRKERPAAERYPTLRCTQRRKHSKPGKATG